MNELKLTDLISNHVITELQKMIISKNGIETGLCCADAMTVTGKTRRAVVRQERHVHIFAMLVW